MELRSVDHEAAEIRMENIDGRDRLTGYAAVYNRLSQDLGGFVERIKPGAFDAVLANQPDVIAAFNHDPSQLLGRTRSGTLQLISDERGLKYMIDLPTTRADIAELVKRGDLRGSSFAFSIQQGGDKYAIEDGVQVRTIYRFQNLFDVGPVTNPAYLDTTVAMRSLEAARQALPVGSCEWLRLRLKIA
jgi:hypothetical protein